MSECRYTQRNLNAYIHRDLLPSSRRRVAEHLNECPKCYAHYVTQRNLERQLTNSIPALGKPSQQQIAQSWTAIQHKMSQPQPTTGFRYHYSLAVIAFIIAIALPLTFSNSQPTVFAVPLPPEPTTVAFTHTATETEITKATLTATAINPAETPTAYLRP